MLWNPELSLKRKICKVPKHAARRLSLPGATPAFSGDRLGSQAHAHATEQHDASITLKLDS
jgi:hypothetical protein